VADLSSCRHLLQVASSVSPSLPVHKLHNLMSQKTRFENQSDLMFSARVVTIHKGCCENHFSVSLIR
jgi:hypothetical protein